MEKAVLDPFPVLREVPDLLPCRSHYRFSVVRTYPTQSAMKGLNWREQDRLDEDSDWTEFKFNMVQALTLANVPEGEKNFTYPRLGLMRDNLIEKLKKIMSDHAVLRKNDSEHLFREIKSSQPGLSKQGQEEWVHGVLLATARNAENHIESIEYLTHIMNTIVKAQEVINQDHFREYIEGETPGTIKNLNGKTSE